MSDLDRIKAVETLIAEYSGKPFVLGVNDCWTLANRAVELVTGAPMVDKWRGYKTIRGALRAIKEHGADDVLALLDGKLSRVGDGAHPRVGDIVAIQSDDPDWPALGVCLGFGQVFVARDGTFGLDLMGNWTGLAWRVG